MSCDEYISKIPEANQSKLDTYVTPHHCVQIGEELVNWEILAPFLELTKFDVGDIIASSQTSLKLQG